MHKSNPLLRPTRKPSPQPTDNLVIGRRAFSDAGDIAKDERRHLPLLREADPDEITQNGHGHHHTTVTVNMPHAAPSQPDTEPSIEVGPVKVSGLPRWAIVAIGGVIAVGAAVAASLMAHR